MTNEQFEELYNLRRFKEEIEKGNGASYQYTGRGYVFTFKSKQEILEDNEKYIKFLEKENQEVRKKLDILSKTTVEHLLEEIKKDKHDEANPVSSLSFWKFIKLKYFKK